VEARILSSSGKVDLINSSVSGRFSFVPKYKLEPGTEIVTGDNGRVVISLTDGSQVIIQPKSRVKFQDFRSANSVRELLQIIVGRVRIKIRHAAGTPNPYRLNSPSASIAVRGTDFLVDVIATGETSVFVYEGLVEVTSLINPDNKRLVAPGDRVIVRPGGDISMAFPGPGSELNGKSRGWKDVSQIYQQSINSFVQNSTEISPVIFSAFADPHLDSLENPAYAAEFTTAQGRVSFFPSARRTDNQHIFQGQESSPPYRYDYSLLPQITFYTPVPGTKLTLGAGISAVRSNMSDLLQWEYTINRSKYSPGDPISEYLKYNEYHTSADFNVANLNLLNFSLIAAYSLGDEGRTSIGVGFDHMSGNGSLQFERHQTINDSSFDNVINSKTRLSRTRISFGLAHEFSGGRKFGLFIRRGQSSSAEKYEQRLNSVNWSSPIDLYVLPVDRLFTYSNSSEIGLRWRAPLTRRITYGAEGSLLYDDLLSTGTLRNGFVPITGGGSWRARLGGGLGFALRPKTFFSFDLAAGHFKTSNPLSDRGISLYPTGYLYTLAQMESERSYFLSTHAAFQSKLWMKSFISASYLMTFNRNYLNLTDDPFPSERRDNRFTALGAGWKFKPNLAAQYMISLDHSPYAQRISSHSLVFRYTFDLKITREK